MDENNWGAFDGEFRANFILPNYLGIGNGITRGYGTLFGLFNPEMFAFNEGDLQKLEDQAVKDDFDGESAIAESDLQEIDVDKVPRSKKVPGKDLMPSKRSKKVLSEEFEIEEDEMVYETHVTKPDSEPKDKPIPSKPKKKRGRKPKKDTSDVNYNSEEYQQKTA